MLLRVACIAVCKRESERVSVCQCGKRYSLLRFVLSGSTVPVVVTGFICAIYRNVGN